LQILWLIKNMAGSRKWFIYTDDIGSEYAINLDESNTEALNGTALGFVSGTSDAVPRNIKPREIFYSNAARTRTIRCVALTPTIYSGALAGGVATIVDPIAGTGNLGISRANGERRRIPTPIDTGLDDGDQP
jgi:hypothetical protein